MTINETSGNDPSKRVGASSAQGDQKPNSGRELVAEGLNADQVKQLLNQLKAAGKINGIGTPSRDEIISPPATGSGVATALGGLFQGGPMDQMLVDMTTQLLESRGDGNGKYDISITRIPLAGSPMGISEASVAQVYPSDAKTPAIEAREFGELMAKVDSMSSPEESPARKLEMALKEQPDSIDENGKDLSYDELAIRLRSLVNNNRVNVILSDGDEKSNEDVQTTTQLADDIERHLEKVKQAAGNNESARYKLSLRNYNNPTGIQGRIVAAHLQVDQKETPDGYAPSIENLTADTELIAEGLEAKEAGAALKTLWADRRMDTLSIGSYKIPSDSAVFPSAGFKGDDGKPMSTDELLDKLTQKLSDDYPGKGLDLLLSDGSPMKRTIDDKPSEGNGFHVRVLADDHSDQ